ncbi:hypothetical protein [Leucobacter luti]|uniref:hypothetical protein n=1 Tax=Leucobacter luti TaxID=340320 RepID=UPI001C690A4E|nr:hypothetical protein [Leucobacter luti]QYM76911.1 hypothetical protein K1X41_05915 [Leucobacter luti]
MAISEKITIEIASVVVSDEYRVELRQEKKLTAYSSQQARDLALELIEAAERADAAIAEDMEVRSIRQLREQLMTPRGEVVL